MATRGRHSHSLDIPTPKHFCRRQNWQRFLVTLLMMQFLSRWHVYTMFFWMLRRKKPCTHTHTKNTVVTVKVLIQLSHSNQSRKVHILKSTLEHIFFAVTKIIHLFKPKCFEISPLEIMSQFYIKLHNCKWPHNITTTET